MKELPNKMLICGYSDYGAFCNQIADKFKKLEREKAGRNA